MPFALIWLSLFFSSVSEDLKQEKNNVVFYNGKIYLSSMGELFQEKIKVEGFFFQLGNKSIFLMTANVENKRKKRIYNHDLTFFSVLSSRPIFKN